MSKGIVLSVDDDEVNQVVITSFLEGANYSVRQAFSGEESIEYLEAAFADDESPDRPPKPDIVLMDVIMPGMDGYAACKMIRERFPATLPIILISARFNVENIIHGLNFGLANDYLTKPFDRTILLAKIEARIFLKKSIEQTDVHDMANRVNQVMIRLDQNGGDIGKGCMLIVLRGGVPADEHIPDILKRLLDRLGEETSITCREIQYGLCVFTSLFHDDLLNFCCNIFGDTSISQSVVKNALCFCIGEGGEVADILGLAMKDVPPGTIQATERFISHLSMETLGKYFQGSSNARQVDSPRSNIPIRSLAPLDELLDYVKHCHKAPIDPELAGSFIESIETLEHKYVIVNPIVNSSECSPEPSEDNVEDEHAHNLDRRISMLTRVRGSSLSQIA
jgi:CheY-like chemotaxis protein